MAQLATRLRKIERAVGLSTGECRHMLPAIRWVNDFEQHPVDDAVCWCGRPRRTIIVEFVNDWRNEETTT